MIISQEAIVFIICGLVVLLCLTQWVVIKIFIYKNFHFTELSLTPQKISEKEKIRQNALVFFFMPLIAIVVLLKTIPVVEIIFVIIVFLILFGFFYFFLNKKLK